MKTLVLELSTFQTLRKPWFWSSRRSKPYENNCFGALDAPNLMKTMVLELSTLQTLGKPWFWSSRRCRHENQRFGTLDGPDLIHIRHIAQSTPKNGFRSLKMGFRSRKMKQDRVKIVEDAQISQNARNTIGKSRFLWREESPR